jgi:hypothetical protein
MIAALFLTTLLAQQDPTYAELSKKHGLAAADQNMREGKYLEAAVAYRNVLMSPGDREAVRIPLALALLAKGDAVYAGIEIRRAHLLYPDFARLSIDAAELLGSKGALAKIVDGLTGKAAEGDEAEVNAAAAYAYLIDGEKERSQTALSKYVQLRGSDAFAKDVKSILARAPAAKTVVAAATPAPAAQPLTPGGSPIRAGIRFVEVQARPRGEILSK